MKKAAALLLVLFFLSGEASADHISGGELYYECLGPYRGLIRYKVILRLFRDCHSTGQPLATEKVTVGVYHNDIGQGLFTSLPLQLELPIQKIEADTDNACFINVPEVCYEVGIFSDTVDLASTEWGYRLVWQRCCRSAGIANMDSTVSFTGASFFTQIPGTNALPAGLNSSPQFFIKDTALVCRNNVFELDFGAIDPDGDRLRYNFCWAYNGASPTDPNPQPPDVLSLMGIKYRQPFTASSPLGPWVTIDPETGKVRGIAPNRGRYVVTVCVDDYRDGLGIASHRKDFIIEVGECDIVASDPSPGSADAVTGSPDYSFALCDGYQVKFDNIKATSSIHSYSWDFGVGALGTDTSTYASPSFTFPDTGVYKVRLVVRGTGGCVDTGFASIGVYPGLKADFDISGTCYQYPVSFYDRTTISYGSIKTWRWDFGEPNTSDDTSWLQNPTYLFPTTRQRTAALVVTSTKGCIDTAYKVFSTTDKATLTLPFHDTLICHTDTLPLMASGNGTFSWRPLYNISNATTSTPLVFPKDTTTYIVTLGENGCTAIDSIKVYVIDTLLLDAGNDTSICFKDDVMLLPQSVALHYKWSSSHPILSSPGVKNPIVQPDVLGVNIYQVKANVGKCLAHDSVTVKAIAYPVADAGRDDTVCYAGTTVLNASIIGTPK